MAIKFNEQKQRFTISTPNTNYIFDLFDGKHLIHRYYGKPTDEAEYKAAYRSFSPYLPEYGTNFSKDTDLSEFPFFGSGDFRCTALKLRSANGDCCTDFIYKDYEIFDGRESTGKIPCAKADSSTQTLKITMEDAVTGCILNLFYTVFEKYDIITRYFTLQNGGSKNVKIEKAMSLCLDINGRNFDMITLNGAHVRERNIERHPLFVGNQSVMSRRGASSHQFNPFFAVVSKDADEESGDVYAFNLVYSGNFLDEVEVDQNSNTRIMTGLGEENFGYLLEQGESFVSPEAVMTYTDKGLGEMSRRMHRFVRGTILPPDPFEKRPIVLNTWEASYFDIDQKLLEKFAAEAVKYGIDMLVMDDGWFGRRNNSTAGLGDWYVNREKFPQGLKSLVDKIKSNGIKFGIWIEPEMVNPDSDLYRAHPEYCICCKDRRLSQSRTQYVLDLGNPDVLDYLKKSFAEAFEGIDIDYIKWDFNRHLSEVGSNILPAERQDEAAFRFMLGVYDLFRWFEQQYPGVMIENCSGGGGRYDLAMMAVSTQIWTSDNTRARNRNLIQYGSLLAYPSEVMSCHVSNPGNDDDRLKKADYKYKVALGGMLGYELNILNMNEDVLQQIKNQTSFYRYVENVIKYGDLYRLVSPFETKEEISSYYYVREENSKQRILFSFLQSLAAKESEKYVLPIKAAKPGAVYTEKLSGEKFTGEELINGITVETADFDENGKIMLFEEQ